MATSPPPASAQAAQLDATWAAKHLEKPFEELVEAAVSDVEIGALLEAERLPEFDPAKELREREGEIVLEPTRELGELWDRDLALRSAERAQRRDAGGSDEPGPVPRRLDRLFMVLLDSPIGFVRRLGMLLTWFVGWTPASTEPGLETAGTERLDEASQRSLESLRSERDVAALIYTQAVEKALLRVLRPLIDDRARASYATALTIVSAPGLAELTEEDIDLDTAAGTRLRQLLTLMKGGSIGISGPRGVGKTTLLRGFSLGRHRRVDAADDRPFLSVLVSAPVVYEGRDFVLHLYASLCKQVLQTPQGSALSKPVPDDPKQLRRALMARIGQGIVFAAVPAGAALVVVGLLDEDRVAAYLPVIGLFAVTVAALYVRFTARRLPKVLIKRVSRAALVSAVSCGLAATVLVALDVALEIVPAVAWGAAIALAAAGAVATDRVFGVEREVAPAVATDAEEVDDVAPTVATNLEQIAFDKLDSIRYQQTYTSGWSGALKLPIGIEGGLSASTQLAERQMGFPDVVADLGTFLRSACTSHDVLIAIDELDKLESGEVAGRFLNEIKGIFGIERCFYLVSVSEDAMTKFERRGLPLRDEFDSAFDDVLQVGYLTLDEARNVLKRRVALLPVPFLLLAYCVSGGLPRDLIRTMRTLVDLNANGSRSEDLGSLSEKLVAQELSRRARAARVLTRSIATEPHASAFLRWIEDLQRAPTSATLLARCRAVRDYVAEELPTFDLPTDGDDPYVTQRRDRERLVNLCLELTTVAYFSATVLDYFRATRGRNDFEQVESAASGRPAIEVLAAGRQAFATNRREAWALVSEFRRLADLPAGPDHPALAAPAFECATAAPPPVGAQSGPAPT